MHISPIRFSEDRPAGMPEPPYARSAVVAAVLVFAVLAAAASIVLTPHGVALPCGDAAIANCTLG